jgi:Uma2 family endonuclease
MGQATLLSTEEYLANIWHPDCDLVNGELQERNLGELSHARLQALLGAYFYPREKQWNVLVAPELRIQVSADRYRVADYCVISRSAPREQVIQTPPLLTIEVLSPEDRVNRTEERIADYLAMGIPHVWLIDPESKRAWIYTREHRVEVTDGILRATPPIEVPLAVLFDED